MQWSKLVIINIIFTINGQSIPKFTALKYYYFKLMPQIYFRKVIAATW